ncbi:MAG: hypothetical protein KF895_02605 [Parvibaculum sp.]|nr:hypothetical protein [Parvibaculum sp.]
MTDIDITQGWPESLLTVKESIGLAATLRLVEAFGGTSCYIPAKADVSNRLVQVIGVDATEALIRDLGAGAFDVPVLATARHKRRLIMRAKGTAREVARKFAVTERWVRYVRADERGSVDERQMDMFGSSRNADRTGSASD